MLGQLLPPLSVFAPDPVPIYSVAPVLCNPVSDSILPIFIFPNIKILSTARILIIPCLHTARLTLAPHISLHRLVPLSPWPLSPPSYLLRPRLPSLPSRHLPIRSPTCCSLLSSSPPLRHVLSMAPPLGSPARPVALVVYGRFRIDIRVLSVRPPLLNEHPSRTSPRPTRPLLPRL